MGGGGGGGDRGGGGVVVVGMTLLFSGCWLNNGWRFPKDMSKNMLVAG